MQAAALSQVIAPAPQPKGPAKPESMETQSPRRETPSVEDADRSHPADQSAAASAKPKPSFADRLKDKLKTPEEEQDKPSQDPETEASEEAVMPFQIEGYVPSPTTLKVAAQAGAIAGETPIPVQGKASPETAQSLLPDAKTPNTNVKVTSEVPADISKGADKMVPEVQAEASKVTVKQTGDKPEAPADKEARATEKAVPATRETAADPLLKTAKPEVLTSDPAKQIEDKGFLDTKAASTNAQTAPVIKPESAAAAYVQKPDSESQLKAEGQAGSDKKAKVEPTASSQSAENQPQVRADAKEFTLPSDRVSVQNIQSPKDTQGLEDSKSDLQVAGVKETKSVSSNSLFAEPTPSQQIIKHLPNADVLNARQIRITLNPAELGTVRITFQRDGGEITGLVETQRAEVRREIEQAMPQIISTLQQQGLQVRRIDVSNMNDSTQQQHKDQSAFANDPSMQREFSNSHSQNSGHAGRYSPGRSYAQSAELAEEAPKSARQQGTYTGSGLNFYL